MKLWYSSNLIKNSIYMQSFVHAVVLEALKIACVTYFGVRATNALTRMADAQCRLSLRYSHSISIKISYAGSLIAHSQIEALKCSAFRHCVLIYTNVQ